MQTPRRRWRTLVTASVLATAVTVAFTGVPIATAVDAQLAKGAPKVKSPVKEGTKQANRYLSLLKGKPTAALKSFLSPGFLLQRADGTSATRSSYLSGPVTNIKSFKITDVQANVVGSTLVVRYTATVDQIVEGQAYKRDPAPRLSTFVWQGGAWRLLAHANFNTPAAS